MIDNGQWAGKPCLAGQPSTFIRNDGLGEDAHGGLMVKLYLDRIDEIRNLILR